MKNTVPLAGFDSFSLISKYQDEAGNYQIAIDEQIRDKLLDNGQNVTYWFFNKADKLYHYCKLLDIAPHHVHGYRFKFRILSSSYKKPE